MTITSWSELNVLERALDRYLSETTPYKDPRYNTGRALHKKVVEELMLATDEMDL